MAQHQVEIQSIESLTHNVKKIITHKPSHYAFQPGQATDLAIDKEGWREEWRPFTFTSLPEDDYLEFTIKCYRDHRGVTQEIENLNLGDRLFLGDAWGAITYQGPGIFLAGGAGVTPFISIFRKLAQEDKLRGNKLLFSNHTRQDVILEDFWNRHLGPNFKSILTEEGDERLNTALLRDFADGQKQFYLCGPEGFVEAGKKSVEELGGSLDQVVLEG